MKEVEESSHTSDTSSYMSDFQEERKASVEEHQKNELVEMGDEFEDNTVSSYAKFKTQNEIDLE